MPPIQDNTAAQRVAIVTGAARGIGAAIADALHAERYDLVLVDRCQDDDRLDYPLSTPQALAAVSARCGGAATVIGDVSDPAVNRQAVELAQEEFGRLDVAIASAAVMAGTVDAWEIDEDSWAAMFDTNVTGTLGLARAAIPAMLAQSPPRSSRFLAIASPIALKATPKLAGYAASKAAVASYVRSMAADLRGTGITANVVAPGSTRTELLLRSAEVYDLADPSEFAAHHLNDRLLEPAEVAAGVAWLCGSDSGAITGAVVPIDSGMSAQ